MKVLVIEEDKFARSIYESELHQQNVNVESAENGLVGYNKVMELMPDLIIMELILTKLNGFELLRRLKTDETTKDIPVIVCSALSHEQDIEEAKRYGAMKYFPKDNYSIKQVIKEVMDILVTL